MNQKQFFLLTVLIELFNVYTIEAIRCYVCDDEGAIPCTQFENDKNMYVTDCKETQNGCSLKIKGIKRTRSCEDKKLQDCRVANSVKYCFCFTDLCNDDEKFLSLSDDEDLYDEGSGAIMVATEKPKILTSSIGINVQRLNGLFLILFICTIYV